MVILITKDLFFVPMVRGVCERLETTLTVGLNPDSQKIQDCEPASVRACLIDLSSLEAKETEPAIQRLKEQFSSAQFIAYGPHVQVPRLEAATRAGCDLVITRGQLNSQIDTILAKLFA